MSLFIKRSLSADRTPIVYFENIQGHKASQSLEEPEPLADNQNRMLTVYDIVSSWGGLGQVSLLLILLLPFSYYAYHGQFWYSPERLRMLDFLLQTVSGLLGVAALLCMYGAGVSGEIGRAHV